MKVFIGSILTMCFDTAQRIEEVRKIREAIAKASSLEEVERLNQILQTGQIPGHHKFNNNNNNSNAMSGNYDVLVVNFRAFKINVVMSIQVFNHYQ